MSITGIGFRKMDRGSSLLEFALIAVMFVLVLLGVVEMGRMVLVYTTVANAARAGARYAIVHGGDRTGTGADGPSGPGSPCTCTQVKTVVKNFASAGLLTTSNLNISVTYPNGVNTAGSPVSVTVTYPYDPLVAFFNPLLSNTLGSTSQGVITF
jgi:Flp pilus assembly protein TadG